MSEAHNLRPGKTGEITVATNYPHGLGKEQINDSIRPFSRDILKMFMKDEFYLGRGVARTNEVCPCWNCTTSFTKYSF